MPSRAIETGLGGCAHANLMKFNKAKCNILHKGQGNLEHTYRLGREWLESSHLEKCDQQGEGGDSVLLLL